MAKTGSRRPGAELAAFAADLRALRLECGNPSYARLRRASPLLPPATVSDALSGKVTPRLEFVLAFVDACVAVADSRKLRVDPLLADRGAWQKRWQSVRRAADLARQGSAGGDGHDRAIIPEQAGPGYEAPGQVGDRPVGDRPPGPARRAVPAQRHSDPGTAADSRRHSDPGQGTDAAGRRSPGEVVDAALIPEQDTGEGEPPPAWQLPNATRRLVGRVREIEWLDSALGSASDSVPDSASDSASGRSPGSASDTGDDEAPAPAPARIAVLEGMGGVGKTALALAWGHRHRRDFPDGQLFADLGGYGPGSPVEPTQVLAAFVQALGAQPQAIPGDVMGLAALYRSLCSDRKILVVLDNASDAEQVRPLLPAAPGVAVIVTSRATLRGLAVRDDAQRIEIRPLASDDAVALLSGRLSAGLPPGQLNRLAAACGNLPLALRLAASRLSGGADDVEVLRVADGSPVDGASRQLMAMLADRSDPFSDVSVVLSWSLSRSSAAERRALLLLSEAPGRTVDYHAAAALIGLAARPARDLLRALAEQHLLERRPDGWHLHDLVRSWAREEGRRTLGRSELRDARRRAFGYYLWTADAVDRVLLPQRGRPDLTSPLPRPLSGPSVGDEIAALGWGDLVLPSLVDVMHAAHAAGELAFAAALPHILLSYLNRRKPWAPWIAMCRIGLRAAEQLGDVMSTANLHVAEGIACRETHELAGAIEHFAAAGDGFRRAGNRTGAAMALNNLGTAYRQAGNLSDARDALLRAVADMADSVDDYRRAIVWHNLAEVEYDLADFPAAAEHVGRALTAELAARDDLGAAITRTTLASIQSKLGHPDIAEREFAAAAAVQRAAGARLVLATTQRRWGELLVESGRNGEAVTHLAEAAAILSDLGDPAAADVADILGRARHALRDPTGAR